MIAVSLMLPQPVLVELQPRRSNHSTQGNTVRARALCNDCSHVALCHPLVSPAVFLQGNMLSSFIQNR